MSYKKINEMHKSFGNTANVDFAQISQLRIFEKHKFDFEE